MKIRLFFHLFFVGCALSGIAVLAAAEDSYRASGHEPSVPAAITASSPVDHDSPAALDELAIQKIRQGDAAVGRILLERAVLLAPHDARIRRHLEASKAHFGPPLLPSVLPASTDRAQSAAPVDDSSTMPPAPPPLWPRH